MVLSPDVAQGQVVPQQSRRAIILCWAALFDQGNGNWLSNDHLTSATRVEASDTQTSRVAPYLAKRFLELKQLRQQVDELERSAAIEGRQRAAPADGARHRK